MNALAVGAVCGFLAVALGAFGAHALKSRLSSDRLEVYETGVTYQMYHALALVGTGILAHLGVGGTLISVAAWLFLAGIILFSGSLYVLCLSGKRAFGAITPLGGLCFLAGWALLLAGAV
ncbi:membrane protein [Alicyclobacillus contaminans]|uniref:DUF423 domain-containing protein n=1 Tax=Alicyclobacillus contaminans TaxID=392016 RepID=UPI0003F78325|nr:DUF423 domain-containing protein [Alicyclobacillus contaminans]GMA50387.1 membrane protein [Alicyclobacillus contaminans]